MFNELTMAAPSNMVSIDPDSIENVSFIRVIVEFSDAIKRFFSVERCLQIIAAAAVLDILILLSVLAYLTVSGGTSPI